MKRRRPNQVISSRFSVHLRGSVAEIFIDLNGKHSEER